MMLISLCRSTMAVNHSVAFCRVRLRSDGLVANMVVRSRGVKLNCYVEEYRGLGGNILRRLDNGDFAGLIYSSLFLTD